MRKKLTVCLAGAAMIGCMALAAVDLMAAASEDPAPRADRSQHGLWGLLEELVQVPNDMRANRTDRIANALREDRKAVAATPDRNLIPKPFQVIAPPKFFEVPAFELMGTESPAAPKLSDGLGLGKLLDTYRTLSPAMKRRLGGMNDADMVRAVERLARAERELEEALNSK